MKKLAVLIPIVVCITGCATANPIDLITPTVVPPLAEELGYEIPNIKGVTTSGIVKGVLAVEHLKLKTLDESAHVTLTATNAAVDKTMGLLALLGVPVAGALVPRVGEKKKVKEALHTPVPNG